MSSDKLFGITRTRSSVAKRRAGEDEPYDVSEHVSYTDTETGEEITDPERIAEFEREQALWQLQPREKTKSQP